MKLHNIFLALALSCGGSQVCAQTAPTGSDNQGGVACPAGTYFATPNIPLVSLNAYTANATREVDDLSVASVSEVGLNWTRYNNTRATGGAQWFGQGANWRHSFQWDFTQTTVGGVPTIQVVYPEGTANSFTQTSPNVWTSTSAVTDVITPSGTNYILTTASLQQYVFNSSGQLASIIDSKGQVTSLTYTTYPASGSFPAFTALTQITEPAGRYLSISYISLPTAYEYDGETHTWFYPTGFSSQCIHKVTTSDGRTITYSYGAFSWTGTLPAPEFGFGYQYINFLAGGTYTDSTSCAYTYVQLTTHGTPVLSQAIDPRTSGIDNIIYRYFTGASDPLGAVKTVTEGSSNTLICTVSLLNGNAQTPEVTFPDGSYFQYHVNTGGLLASVTNSLNNSESFAYTLGTGTRTVSVTDSNMNTTSATWTTSGHLLSRSYPAVSPETTGPTETWNYNSAGYVTSYVDLRLHTTQFTRDPTTNLIMGISYPDGTSESYTYTTFNEPLTHTRRNEGTEYFTYDTNGDGLLWKFQDATQNLTHLTTISHNPQFLISSVQDANGHSTGYLYNDEDQITQITNPDATTELFTYGPKMVSTFTNELGNEWFYSYDGFDRILSIKDPLTHSTTYSYSSTEPTNPEPTLVTLPTGKKTEAAYTQAWTYETTSITTAYNTSDASTTQYGYDAVGNVTSVTDPRTYLTHISYDARNRIQGAQDPAGNTSSYFYDDNSNLKRMTTPDGSTFNVYDFMNRLTQSTDPDNRIVQLQYDSEGSLQHYYDPNLNEYSYGYDLDERQTSMIYPDSTSEGYSYDFVGNLLTYTNRKLTVMQPTSYDTCNRPLGYTWNDGVTPAVSIGYDNAGRLTSLSNTNSALSYGYDSANETLSETENVTGLGSEATGYAYNSDGTLNTLTYPDGTVLTYGYNNRNQVTSIKQGSITAVSYTYDTAGNRTGKNLANGVTSTLTYDNVERLTSIQDLTPSPTSGTLLQRFDYGYDGMSRRKYVKRNSALGDVYAYDTSGQVVNVQYNATNPDTIPTSPLQTVAYTLDSAGNRSQVVDSLHGTTTYGVNGNNQYSTINGILVGYDQNGNLTGFNGETCTYDAQNHLVQASAAPNSMTQAFDPLGRCVKRVQNGMTTYMTYDLGWSLLADYNSSGTETNRYVFGAGVDEPIGLTNSSGQTYFYHTDGHGSVSKLTNSAGAIVEQYSYDIFGEPTITNASGTVLPASAYGNRFMFTGREYLSSLDLYDYRERAYSPAMGRFLQPDPIGHAGDGYNINRFCGNDPVNNSDPFGDTQQMEPIVVTGADVSHDVSYDPLFAVAFPFGGTRQSVNESSRNEKSIGVAVTNGVVSGLQAGAKESSKVQNSNPNYSSAPNPTPPGGSALGAPPSADTEQNNGWSGFASTRVDTDPSLARGVNGAADMVQGVINTAMAALPVGELGVGASLLGRASGVARYAGPIPAVTKAVNSEMAYAAARAVQRGVFNNPAEASVALRQLSAQITKTGQFPAGTILDSHVDRVLVPIGNNGYAVYQILSNGTARLRNVLIRM